MAKLKGGTRVFGSATIDTTLTATDVTILGNLNIKGTTTTVDTAVSTIKDPVITLGADENGASTNDGLDRGLVLRYNDGADKSGFMGWDQSNTQFALADTTTFDAATNSVLITTYGNLKAGHFIGEGDMLANITGDNVTGTVRNANMSAYAGNVVNAAQGNITSLGELTGLSVNGTANFATINGNGIVSFSNTAESTSTTTGALKVAGGAGIGGNLYVGGNIYGNFAGEVLAKGLDTYVQFNDNNKQNATAGFTFNKSGNILTVTGNVVGGNLSTAGTLNVTGIANIANTANVGNLETDGDITYQGYLTGYGDANIQANVFGLNLNTSGVVSADGNVSGGNLTTTGDVTTVTVTASGNISTTANLSVSSNAAITGTANAAGGFTTGANIDGTGSSSTLNIKYIEATGTANITGTATVGNLSTAGAVDATGTVTGGNLATTGTANIGNLQISGSVHGSLIPDADVTYDLGSSTHAWKDLWLSGNSIKLGQQSISSNSTTVSVTADLGANNIVITNNANVANLNATASIIGANVTSNALHDTRITFAGTGGLLTDDSTLTFASATLTAPNVSVTTNANVGGTLGVTGNTTLGNLSATATTVTTLAAGDTTITGTANISSTLDVTGNTTLGNLSATATTVTTLAAGDTTITGYANASGNVTGANLVTAGMVDATGNVSGGNLVTSGNVNVTTTVNTPNVVGATSLTLSTQAGGITLNAYTGIIDANGGTLGNLATPVNASDAATKGYVDGVATGLDIKNSVRVATNTNITLSGLTTQIDGVTLSNNDRVLVKSQTNATENGIYVASSGSWSRSDDANATGELTAGSFTFVEEGSLYQDSGWVVSTNGAITLGTTGIEWTQFSGAGQLTASNGVQLVGSNFSAVVDDSTIDIVSGAIHVKDGLTLVTPNIGVATGSSLDVGTGNLVAGNAIIGGGTGGSITGANLVSANYFTGTLTTAAQPNITSVGTLTDANVAGTLNVATGAVVANAGGIYTDGYYYANGDQIDFQTAAGTDYQIQFHKYGANDLDASANLTFNAASELGVTGTANISGLVTAGNIVDNSLTSTQLVFAGSSKELVGSANLTFAADTLTTVTANVTTLNAGNVVDSSLTSGRVTFAGTSGKLQDDANLTFSANELGVTGTANISGTVTAGNLKSASLTTGRVTFAGTGNVLTDSTGLTFDSMTGELQSANANVAGYFTAGNVTARNLTNAGRIVIAGSAGLLSDNANLSFDTGTNTLYVDNATASDTITAAQFVGNGVQITNIAGANVTGTVENANVAVTISASAQPNITSVSSSGLTSLKVTGTTDLGAVGNVTITGGTSGAYLKTDGFGVLSWATVDSSQIANGTSSVSIPAANGDITITRGGTLVLTVTGTGANVTGTLDVTGDINGNNISAASSITVVDGADSSSATTGAITVAGGIGATGNIYTGHSVGFANNNGGTASAAYIQFNATANSLDFIFN